MIDENHSLHKVQSPMGNEMLNYIKNQRVCVVAVEMPDGSPHAATVHFAHIDDPLTFIIQADPNSRKSEPLKTSNSVRASLVVGLQEVPGGKEKTFQMDGTVKIVDSDSNYANIYLDKFPEKVGKWKTDIFFIVTPTWWRFTDWSRPEGKTIINSDGSITVKGVVVK